MVMRATRPIIDFIPPQSSVPLPPHSRDSFAPRAVIDTQGERITLQDGRQLRLRPLAATDVLALQRCFTRLSSEDIRRRFLHAMSELPEPMARRLCQIDPEQETALGLLDDNVRPAEIRGVGRIFVDEATDSAEFSVLVERSWGHLGLGGLLLQRLIADCRQRGLAELWGYVLLENQPMLELCRELGFERQLLPNEPGTTRVALHLAR
jgi:acetyltransferase